MMRGLNMTSKKGRRETLASFAWSCVRAKNEGRVEFGMNMGLLGNRNETEFLAISKLTGYVDAIEFGFMKD